MEICPRCGGTLQGGFCMSCGYPLGFIRRKKGLFDSKNRWVIK